ncbi:MAG: T9SS type A sorting domain-containing protein [Bacteroidales bacterium]|nr:T9SS type A sorting domain-containing protein [Bacteroidales bacterium]
MKQIAIFLFLMVAVWFNSFQLSAQSWSYIQGSNSPSSIVKDTQHQIWITYTDGLAKLDSSGFQIFEQPFIWGKSAADAYGNIWTAAYSGFLYRFDGQIWTKYTMPKSYIGISSISISNTGVVWIGTFQEGLYRFENGNWTNYDSYWTPTGTYYFSSVNTLAIDTSNIVYFSTNDDLFTANEAATVFHLIDDSVSQIQSNITRMCFDNTGKKWFGTQGNGLICIDADSVYHYNQSNSSIGNYIYEIAVSEDGAIFTHSSKGFIKKEDSIYTIINTQTSGFGGTYGMQIDTNEVIWTAKENGLYLIDNNVTLFPREYGPDLYYINAIEFDSQGKAWVGASPDNYNYNRISVFDGSNWIYYDYLNSGLIVSSVNCIKEDNQDNIWIANTNSLVKFDGTNFINKFFTTYGLPQLGVKDIAVDANDIKWFATYDGVRAFNDTLFTSYTTLNGLYNDNVLTAFVDNQNNKWFGTANGVAMFDGVNWTIDTTNGITNLGRITAINQDNNGEMWFATSGATINNSNWIYKYDGNQWWTFAASDNVNQIYFDNIGNKWFVEDDGISILNQFGWIHYNSPNDLLFTSPKCLTKNPNGELWIGCFEGISVFNGNPLGIAPSKIENDNKAFLIYPNPSTGNITLKSKYKMSSIEIYDLNGRLLLSKLVEGMEATLSLEDFPKGVYLIRAIGPKISYMRKIILK